MPRPGGIQQKPLPNLEDNMTENTPKVSEDTPKSKEEMEKALEDLQLDPEDLDAVAGGSEGTCTTCYSVYTS
jgi:hypothetical protein